MTTELGKTGTDSTSTPRSKAIYEQIRERICLLRYPPGSVLRESVLADEFGVSRTPVRTVLQRLEFEGFVAIRNGVGTIVTGVDFRAFRDVYALRLKLAELIGELEPVTCDGSHIAALQALRARAECLRHQSTPEAFWRINHERQQVIASLIGNTALRYMYDHFYYQTGRVWFELVSQTWTEQVDELCSELDDLLRAMRLGDTQAVAYVERNHLRYYMELIEKFMAHEQPPPKHSIAAKQHSKALENR